jgi:hypothetical protein
MIKLFSTVGNFSVTAVLELDLKASYALGTFATVFQAEVYAIWLVPVVGLFRLLFEGVYDW